MQALEAVRSPLTVCVEHLQQSAGPAASIENAGALAAKLLTDQNTLQACSQIILRDLGLTLRLLRIANSVLLNPGGKAVTSVTHAAALLGTDALAQIVDTVPRHKLAHPARELVALCHLTAVMARNLMGRLEPRYAEEAFVSGLFRNIGELCFALEMPEDYRKILAGSQGQMIGLRASCQRQTHFDFDELSAGLLQHWSLHGPPVLAAQSTPEALFAQHGNPEAEIALAASLAHVITVAHFRCEASEREKLMRPCWAALAKHYIVREAQVENLCAACLESTEGLLAGMDVSKDKLRLREWLPAVAGAEPRVSTAAAAPPSQTTISALLQSAIAKGIDRAAWLRFADPIISMGASAGSGWPPDGASELPRLIHPRKPPYLLAFGQRQDVWIDFVKDHRFRETPLAATLQPSAFFLLPVCDGRRVRGCLYFDWASKRDYSPETLLPALSALRDYMATNMLAM